MPGGDSVGPTQAPWVLVGGSYSGALTSWTMVKCVQEHSLVDSLLNWTPSTASPVCSEQVTHHRQLFKRLCTYRSFSVLPSVADDRICSDFWQYFEPIRQSMPKNCSSDVQAVISHIDKVFTFGPKSEITKIKATFGLQNLTHLDDVAGARESILLVDDMRRLTICEQFATTCGIGRASRRTLAQTAGFSNSAMLSRSRMVSARQLLDGAPTMR